MLIGACWTATGYAAECDEFVSLVEPAKASYQKEHRIYPVPDAIKWNTDWRAIVQVMRGRLAETIVNHPAQHSRGALGQEMMPLD